jgi:4-hydroxy-3-methylbut-2-enyl diphosphate reductase
VIHGKYWHEETRATASQALQPAGGSYLVVLDRMRRPCCATTSGGERSREDFCKRSNAASPGFDPDLHLPAIGCANQTTMLSSESLEIGEMFRRAVSDRYGVESLDARFRAFDTICSATQDRQDAILALLSAQSLDLMIVLGGYNSSNTCNLARICADKLPTYHIADPEGLVSTASASQACLGEARGDQPRTGCQLGR